MKHTTFIFAVLMSTVVFSEHRISRPPEFRVWRPGTWALTNPSPKMNIHVPTEGEILAKQNAFKAAVQKVVALSEQEPFECNFRVPVEQKGVIKNWDETKIKYRLSIINEDKDTFDVKLTPVNGDPLLEKVIQVRYVDEQGKKIGSVLDWIYAPYTSLNYSLYGEGGLSISMSPSGELVKFAVAKLEGNRLKYRIEFEK